MADIQRLYQALDNARAAGDTDAANRLGAAIRRQLGRSPATEQGQREIDSLSIPDSEYQAMKSPAPIDQSLIGGGIREFSKQATLGYGDDISAGLAALLGYGGSGGFGDRFQTNLEYLDRAGNEFADQHPYIATGAGVAGGVAPALAGVGLAARGGSLASKALIGSGVGGAEAFVYGTGDSTGDTGERVANGVDSIPLGAGIGAAAPFVGSAARRVGAAVAAPVMSFFGRGSGPRAERYVGNTIEKSGKSLDEINREIADAITEGQPDFVLADALGRRGQRALSGVARLPGGHQNGIADFLDTRQAGQGERMAGFVRDGFGMRPGGLPDMGASGANSSLPGVNAYQQAGREGISSASQAEEVLSGYRRDISGLNYTSARNDAGPVDVRGTLGLIDSRIGEWTAPISRATVSTAFFSNSETGSQPIRHQTGRRHVSFRISVASWVSNRTFQTPGRLRHEKGSTTRRVSLWRLRGLLTRSLKRPAPDIAVRTMSTVIYPVSLTLFPKGPRCSAPAHAQRTMRKDFTRWSQDSNPPHE